MLSPQYLSFVMIKLSKRLMLKSQKSSYTYVYIYIFVLLYIYITSYLCLINKHYSYTNNTKLVLLVGLDSPHEYCSYIMLYRYKLV